MGPHGKGLKRRTMIPAIDLAIRRWDCNERRMPSAPVCDTAAGLGPHAVRKSPQIDTRQQAQEGRDTGVR
jgi:hypothetical protein